jgi:hypothetical protein
VESCDEITVPAAVFTLLISIAFKLLSAMGTDEGVIGFFLNLLTVVVPPRHTAFVRAEIFCLPTNWLHHGFAAIFARFATVKFRVSANMGTDGAGWDAYHQGNFGGILSLLEHLVNNFDSLLFQG